MATQGDILPRLDNMYAFPIIAMMINLARLHYRMPCHGRSRPTKLAWRELDDGSEV